MEKNEIQKKLDENITEQNSIAKRIGRFMKAGKRDEAEKLLSESSRLKAEAKELSSLLR